MTNDNGKATKIETARAMLRCATLYKLQGELGDNLAKLIAELALNAAMNALTYIGLIEQLITQEEAEQIIEESITKVLLGGYTQKDYDSDSKFIGAHFKEVGAELPDSEKPCDCPECRAIVEALEESKKVDPAQAVDPSSADVILAMAKLERSLRN